MADKIIFITEQDNEQQVSISRALTFLISLSLRTAFFLVCLITLIWLRYVAVVQRYV